MYRNQVITLFLIWLVSTSAVAQQAPEECLRPANWAERTLCADNDLMSLHVQLHRVYNERRAQLDGEAFLDMVSYHHGWLRGREECRTAPDTASQTACLKDLYQTRLAQLAAKPTAGPGEATRAPADPTLLACRGDGASWVMEMGAVSARLRLGADTPPQSLKGRLTSAPRARTSAWRGRETGAAADIVLVMMEGLCTVEGSATRLPLMGRLSLPDGSLLSGCCQRTPASVTGETGAAVTDTPEPARAGGLLPAGSQVRLRDVDGPNVALRKSARISSGNVLMRARAGSVATVEQAAVREGIGWYFLALRDGGKGWVMGELVEPLVAVAVKRPGAADVTPPRAVPSTLPGSPASPVSAPPSSASSETPVATPSITAPSSTPSSSTVAVPGPSESSAASTASSPQPAAELPEAGTDRQSAARGEGFNGPMAAVGQQWWKNLVQHLPVIDACIERARLRTARIVRLEADGANIRNVYTRDGLNNRVVCVVRKGQAVRARVLDREESFPQATGPIFTRTPGQPPSASCYRNQRVVLPGTRTPAGWLSSLKPGRRCK